MVTITIWLTAFAARCPTDRRRRLIGRQGRLFGHVAALDRLNAMCGFKIPPDAHNQGLSGFFTRDFLMFSIVGRAHKSAQFHPFGRATSRLPYDVVRHICQRSPRRGLFAGDETQLREAAPIYITNMRGNFMVTATSLVSFEAGLQIAPVLLHRRDNPRRR